MKLFISYAHADKAIVEKLAAILELGQHNPWYDLGLLPGQNWQRELEAQIAGSDAFVYVLSRASVESSWCQWEFMQAIKAGKPVVPLLFETGADRLPQFPQLLKTYQYADFTEGFSPQHTAKLIAGLNEIAVNIPPERAETHPAPQHSPLEGIQRSSNIHVTQTANHSTNVQQFGVVQGNVTLGGNTAVGGNVGPGAAVGPGAQVQARDIAGESVYSGSLSASQHLDQLMAQIDALLSRRSDADQEAINPQVQELKAEIQKGEAASETNLQRTLQTLKLMSRDIWDVVVATLANPAAGFATVIQKVAARASEQK